MNIQAENKLTILIPHILPILLIAGYITEKPYLFLVLSFLYLAILSLADNFFKRDPSYAYEQIAAMPENEGTLRLNWYWFVNMSFIILDIIALVVGIYYAQHKQPTLGWVLYAIPLSIVSASTLNLCHEFMHTKYQFERIVSRIVSSLSFWSCMSMNIYFCTIISIPFALTLINLMQNSINQFILILSKQFLLIIKMHGKYKNKFLNVTKHLFLIFLEIHYYKLYYSLL